MAEKSFSEILDMLENLMVDALKPYVKEIIKGKGVETDLEQATRNLIAKVGVRIAFGAEVADGILAGQINE